MAMPPHPARVGLGTLLAAAFLASGASGRAEPPGATFHISLSEPGIYAVSYERLAAAGLPGPVPSAGLGLTNRGQGVPIWVEDGGDGTFGPGDRLELAGDRLAGEGGAYFNPFSAQNIYVLETRAAAPLRFSPAEAGAAPAGSLAASIWSVERHLERDLLLLRFADGADEPDLWTWARLTPLDAAPFRLPLDLSGLDPAATEPVRLKLRLKGWSRPAQKPPGQADHRVEARIGGKMSAGEWDQSEPSFVLEPPPPQAAAMAGRPQLSLAVPVRRLADGTPLVDISVLDWIELSYPHNGRLTEPQTALIPKRPGPACWSLPPGHSAVLYGDGRRLTATAAPKGSAAFCAPEPFAGPVWAVLDGRWREPEAVALDLPSNLEGADQQADYLMIVHGTLAAAVEPLAELHRRRGLSVRVIDVQDIYDEWSHGLTDPRAIRAFVDHAFHHWRRPAPRFVLLVGDASWDGKNREAPAEGSPDAAFTPENGNRFPRIEATPYPAAARGAGRNLIPAWSYPTEDGHAAGDNFYVAVDGDDLEPDLAIGRFPVTTAEEVAAIVDKTIRYVERPEVGPWRREVLFVTSEDAGWQGWSDELAADAGRRGFAVRKVYSPPGAADVEALRRALADGQVAVHFIGHGGRFIWRTGPPDWTAQRDLWNLDDVDRLPATVRLPVVLSMTCYSAPFDHPTADSIGERFLRAPGKGAIAVFAAAWRNTPTLTMSRPVLEELLKPGTLGEAIERAKRRSFNRALLEQYNLLGDPALPLAVPPALTLERQDGAGGPSWQVRLPYDRFAGRATVEWLDGAGEVVVREERQAVAPVWALPLPEDAARTGKVRAVKVYAWDEAAGVDALGAAAWE